MAEGTLTRRRARRRAKHPGAASTYPSSHRQAWQHGAGETPNAAPSNVAAELFSSPIFPSVISQPNTTSSGGGGGCGNHTGKVDGGALRRQLDSAVPTSTDAAGSSSNRKSLDVGFELGSSGVSMAEAAEVGAGAGARDSEAGTAVRRAEEGRASVEEGRGSKDDGGTRPVAMATPIRPTVPAASASAGRTFRRISAGGGGGGGEQVSI